MSETQGRPLKLIDVTPADTDLTYVTERVIVTVAGTLVVTDYAGSAPVTLTVTAGVWHQMNVRRIAAASTATGIVAAY